ncbi:MAG: SDR family NAD(P)-dependent oxidoreductase [bacterium]
MTGLGDFHFMATSIAGFMAPDIALAAIRAGEIGIINGESAPSEAALRSALAELRDAPRERCGLRLDLGNTTITPGLLKDLPPQVGWIILARTKPAEVGGHILRLHKHDVRVLVESVELETAQAAETAGADGVIAKGNEAGGWVGEETSFILLQRLRQVITLPIWIQGGIGAHTVAAAYVGGAVGVVLDSALALLQESKLPSQAKALIGRMDGSETQCFAVDGALYFRSLAPRGTATQGLRAEDILRQVGWEDDQMHLLPLGQDACFARSLAERYGTVGKTLRGLRAELQSHLSAGCRHTLLMKDSPWALAHHTAYPIVQGPMTRVSDTPTFARAVADAGGLPFLALGLQRESEIEALLSETRRRLGDKPWGVGLLGFLDASLQEEQLAVVHRHHPPFALIAGGHPEQARSLDQEGILTYLHVPASGLLRLFIEDGARRFIFEGRECGGHVGPLSSFVLWEQTAQVLLESVPAHELPDCHILLAGGIHDATSAAMAATCMTSLAERGVKIGVLMGTAYLSTREAVSSGAILETFQRQALACQHTVLLETGPGHVVRCAPTPYADAFATRKARLRAEGASTDQLRTTLEAMNLGRLRLAAKGVMRQQADPEALVPVNENEQIAGGLYMLGQAAGLREKVCTLQELHHEISVGGTELLRETRPATTGREHECIAIVGMSCLLPGARNLDQFWTNILNKTNSIREVPPTRWDWKLYFDEHRETPDRIYARWGGFLDPVAFDPASYGMPPSSLASIEPIQLLALELARTALRDAGYENRSFPRENTAVIIGVSGGLAELGQDYVLRSALSAGPDRPTMTGIQRKLPEWTEDSFAGILLNVIAGRITNRFDLGGPSFTVDAACASSLAAVYLACRELESGASDMVLVGGADTFQSPFNYLCFCKTQALSPRGRCRTFDHTADGTCISEGLSMLVLKRVSDAERDGDRIYAVIKGVGASSDGRAKGLTAPSPEGQIRALQRAYTSAGVSPATIGLIEAHGTGTVAGDRAETESLRRVFETAGAKPGSVALGSVKSMIGHTKGAAGVTGLLKVAMALHHKVLPATLGVEKPNDSLTNGALYANTETRPWISATPGQPRRAAVSAFGFGGANYHAIVEEYAGAAAPAASEQWPCELFLWRALSVTEIGSRITALLADLKAGARPELKDLSFTLWHIAQHQLEGVTLAIVASSLQDLSAKLETVGAKLGDGTAAVWDTASGTYLAPQALARNSGLAFLFPGQGSQYPDMLRELAVHFHEIREAFETADRTLAGHFGKPLSSFVFPPPRFNEEEERAVRRSLTATHVAQPALGAAATGLLDLLCALGVTPNRVAGHSYGEYAALHAAGCLTAEQLLALSEARGRFITEEAQGDLGAMAAVEADEEKTRALVGDLPDLWIANLNSPRQTIISGAKSAIAAALKRLESQEVTAQAIPVACAFHSPLVAPAKERLQTLLGETSFAVPKLAVYSNSTGGAYPADPAAIRAQLGEHLVSPVRFVAEIEAMYAAGTRVFVEVGPRSVLTGLTEQILGDRERMVVPLETRKRSGLEALLHALAQLAAHGTPVRLDRLFEGRCPCKYALEHLIKETRDAPFPPTAWWVEGGRATPMHSQTLPSQEQKPTVPVSTQGESGNLAAMLKAHEQVMQRLLDTHQRVMAAALGKPPPVVMAKYSAPAPQTPVPAATPIPVAPVSPASPATPVAQKYSAEHIRQEVLRIAGERTGYPPDMLDVDADLEADLGIDSIKRVEIAGRLRKAFPHLGASPDASTAGNLASLRTLRGLIERIASVPVNGSPAVPKPEGVATAEPVTKADADVPVPRFMMRMEDAPAPAEKAGLPQGVLLITDDGNGLADTVADALRAEGARAVVVSANGKPGGTATHYPADFSSPASLHELVATLRRTEGQIAGLIHLRPLRHRAPAAERSLDLWRRTIQEDVKALFYLAQAAAADLKSPPAGHHCVFAVIGMADGFPGHGGLTGLINTLATEWPGLRGRTLALDNRESLLTLAQAIMDELHCDDHARFISFKQGRRQQVRIEPAELRPGKEESMRIGQDWVILITGGACGITAQVALELAERFKPTLVLAGRSPLPAAQEADPTRGIMEPVELRRILAEQLSKAAGKATMADIEAAYRRLCREREIRATLSDLRKTGAKVTYVQTDVRDAQSFGDTVDHLYTEFGRLDGVIHGAGLIEDKRVEDKTPGSFDRVFDTKADGAFILARHLRLDSLKFLVFFSSVASLGNAGQSDYAAANGVLNALACDLDRHMAGRAIAILWGPWQSAGMASEEVQRRFQDRGVQIIPLTAGRRRLIEELLYGRKGNVEVLYGDAPYASVEARAKEGRKALPLIAGDESVIHNNGSVEIACVLDTAEQAYLLDHQLDGKPVFPAAMAMELMAESAWVFTAPKTGGIEITSLQIQQGIVLQAGRLPLRVIGCLAATPPSLPNTSSCSMQIHTSKTPQRANYLAGITLGLDSTPPLLFPETDGTFYPFPLSVPEVYARWLFQGPCFAGITAIEGIRKDAIAGMLHSVSPAQCLSKAPHESQWLIDPTVVDASLQLVILWERHWHNMTPLPMQIGRFRLYHSLSTQPVRCCVKAAVSDGGELLTADLYYTNTQGQLLAVMEGLQCACTRALNRLSNSPVHQMSIHGDKERRHIAAC